MTFSHYSHTFLAKLNRVQEILAKALYSTLPDT